MTVERVRGREERLPSSSSVPNDAQQGLTVFGRDHCLPTQRIPRQLSHRANTIPGFVSLNLFYLQNTTGDDLTLPSSLCALYRRSFLHSLNSKTATLYSPPLHCPQFHTRPPISEPAAYHAAYIAI